MTRHVAWIAAAFLLAAHGAPLHAQVVMSPVASPVDHPLVAGHPVRTAGAWRQGVGRFGESLAKASLELRGYEVIELKLPGNQGIDLVAIKRGSTGAATDYRLVEVKTHYGKNVPHLGETRVGKQMSRQWLADRLRGLRSSGERGRKLALEISRFRKKLGIPLERLGEVHDINIRAGKYTIRNPVSMAERAGPASIERLLNKVASHSRQPASRAWAMRHLSQFDQLRQASMSEWLSPNAGTRALKRVGTKQLALLGAKQAARSAAARALIRAAGPFGIVAAIAVDAYEIYGHIQDYRFGKISQRELTIALARSGGGIAGAWAGSISGAWLGTQVGALGGPFAWVTVPVGGIVGGFVGGVVGYFGGSYVGEFTAQAWYGSLDRDVRDRVSAWLKETPTPFRN